MNLFGSEEGLHQSETGVKINDRMPYYAFDFLASQFKGSLKGKKTLLLGVSYLNDVGDTRYTPVQGFFEQLELAEVNITLHDPHVMYWEEKGLSINQDLNSLLRDAYDLIVITTGHKDYRNNTNLIDRILQHSPLFIYDTIGVLSADEISALSKKHTVRVLGRGDLA
jgi:UDP-N-acetyl-D-mannosaminuronate dehydrogenase